MTRTATPHPLPVKPPAPRAYGLVQISQSNVHAAVYARHRWGGIGTEYGVPLKALGYSGLITRFPATKLGPAHPRDAMAPPELDDYADASLLGCPLIPYILLSAGYVYEWMDNYVPLGHPIFIDEGCGLSRRNRQSWDDLVDYGNEYNTTIGIEPLPDINIPEQHGCPSIIWLSLLRKGNPNWLPVAKRQAEMIVVVDDPVTTREALVNTCRSLTAQGYSVAVYPEAAIQFGIKAKDLLA